MNTYSFERFMSIGNILKSIFFSILILNLSNYFGENLGLDRIVSFSATSVFLFVVLALWLRLSPPIEVKEGEKAIDLLIDYQEVSGCEDIETLRNLIGDYEQKKELLLQSKEVMIQMQSMLVTNNDVSMQTQTDFEQTKKMLEQKENEFLDLQTKFEQSEFDKKQIENELTILQVNFDKVTKESERNLEVAKQNALDLQLERNAMIVADKSLKAEQDKFRALQDEKAEIVLELNKYKAAIIDLKDSDFGKLVSEEATSGFSRGYHNKSLEKKILPKSVIDLLSLFFA